MSNVHKLGEHISKRFDADLDDIINLFLKMGGLVEQQVADAIHSLVDSNVALAEEVVDKDKEVNDFEQEMDDLIVKILAKRQPTASDLRLIFSLSKANTDIERIGDEASKIARIAAQLGENSSLTRGYTEIRHMSNQVRLMIHEALDAFVRLDAEQAFTVMQADSDIDGEYQSAIRSLITYIIEDSRDISKIVNVMWVLRALERIGDHARNIAENVIYCTSGKDIRHTHFDEVEKTLQEKAED